MDIDQLEFLCNQLYTSSDPQLLAHAQKTCSEISDQEDCLKICQILLEREKSSYVQIVALSSLLKYISNKDAIIPAISRLEIRNYSLEYLAHNLRLESFVQKAFINLISKLTKSGWFDIHPNTNEWIFRDILEASKKFLQSGQHEAILIGIKILSQLVTEMEFCSDTELTCTVFTQRKLSASFRDSTLLPVFHIALDLITEATTNFKSLNFNDPLQTGVVLHSLKLADACLGYDFNGTSDSAESASTDDASLGEREYLSVVQLPVSWKSVFSAPNVINNFFCLYSSFVPEISAAALSCLSRVASIRRALFSQIERFDFLKVLVDGVRTIMAEQAHGLNQIEPYHEFCRLLVRIKCNFQLTELMELDTYSEFIKYITDFTILSLQIGYQNTNSNSLHYLLATWQRLVASMYLNPTDNKLLTRGASQVSEAFIKSVLSSIEKYNSTCTKLTSNYGPVISYARNAQKISSVSSSSCIDDSSEDQDEDCFLDDATTFTHQLSQFAVIGRCDYTKTCDIIVEALEQAGTNWQNWICSLSQNQQVTPDIIRSISAEENKLACLVYLIGALLTGRVHLDCTENSTSIDSRLVGRLIQLMRLVECQLPVGAVHREYSGTFPSLNVSNNNNIMNSSSSHKFQLYRHSYSSFRLEMAIMNFMVNFKRMFMTENVSRMTKVYRNLNEFVGLGTEEAIIEMIIRKIFINLKFWSHNYLVLERTLSLFSDLSSSHNSLRKVKSITLIQHILQSPQPHHFPFLTLPDKPTISGIPSINETSFESSINLPGLPFSVQRYRLRSQYYTILTRILMVDLGEDDDRFIQFMAPLTRQINELVTLLFSSELDPNDNFNVNLTLDEARTALIGLARDLTGIVTSLQTKTAFQMFIHWFFPTGFQLFNRAMQMSSSADCQLIIPVLKMLTEIVNNRNGRIKFDSTVPAGYYIVTEISKIINAFKSLSFVPISEISPNQIYAMRLKPIACAMDLLRTCLAGGYVNFGVLNLFRKGGLEELVLTGIELMLSITNEQLQEFTKIAKSYFSLLEYLSRDHMTYIASLDNQVLQRLMETILMGYLSTDTNTCSTSCVCADFMSSYIYGLIYKERKASTATSFLTSVNGNITNLGTQMNSSAKPFRPIDPQIRSLIVIPCISDQLCNVITNSGFNEPTTTTNNNSVVNSRFSLPNGFTIKPHNEGNSKTLKTNELINALAVWGDRATIATNKILSTIKDPNSALVLVTQRMLALLLSLVVYEECKSQWSISRPLFVLMLIHPNYFNKLVENILTPFKSTERRSILKNLFEKLMEDVDRSLFIKNRDKFTENLFSFRQSLTDFIKASSGNGTITNAGRETGSNVDSVESLEVISLSTILGQAANLKISSSARFCL